MLDDDPYGEATAEFYDLLATAEWEAFGPTMATWLSHVDTTAGPIVDVGAGTGVGLPYVVAALPDARIVAIEPSQAMRTALHVRMSLLPELRRSVTVVPTRFSRAPLPERASAVIATAVLGHLAEAERDRLWRYLAEHLVVGAPAVIGVLPPTRPETVPPTRYRALPVGDFVYEGWMQADPVDDRRLRWTMTYRVLDGDCVVSERRAVSVWMTCGADDVEREAAPYGLVVERPDDGHVVVRRS